jgi:hypothetical protein
VRNVFAVAKSQFPYAQELRLSSRDGVEVSLLDGTGRFGRMKIVLEMYVMDREQVCAAFSMHDLFHFHSLGAC